MSLRFSRRRETADQTRDSCGNQAHNFSRLPRSLCAQRRTNKWLRTSLSPLFSRVFDQSQPSVFQNRHIVSSSARYYITIQVIRRNLTEVYTWGMSFLKIIETEVIIRFQVAGCHVFSKRSRPCASKKKEGKGKWMRNELSLNLS